jgi:hypothetical protein
MAVKAADERKHSARIKFSLSLYNRGSQILLPPHLRLGLPKYYSVERQKNFTGG